VFFIKNITLEKRGFSKLYFYKVDELEYGIDYNIFNGTEEELIKNWSS